MRAYTQLEMNDNISVYTLIMHADRASAFKDLHSRRRGIGGDKQLYLPVERWHLNAAAKQALHRNTNTDQWP